MATSVELDELQLPISPTIPIFLLDYRTTPMMEDFGIGEELKRKEPVEVVDI